MAPERWQSIPGFLGYQASSLGRIRSVDRTLSDGRTAGGVVLTATEDPKGYLRVTLSIGGKPATRPVHVLVCLAFHGRRPRGQEALHQNGIKSDCSSSNLTWGTRSKNELDKASHRRHRLSRLVPTRLGRL